MILTANNGTGVTADKLIELEDTLPMSCYCKQQKKKASKSSNQLRSIALIFFLLACLYWLYKVYTNATGLGHGGSNRSNSASRTKLKLISIFNRHGDRSPSDSLPVGDEFNQKPKFFWPNGLSNLTDSGKFRQFRVGLELRKRYGDLLDYNASNYLAFSSPIFRCQESLEHTLRGIFDIEWPLDKGLKLIDRYNADVSGNQDCLAMSKPLVAPAEPQLKEQQQLVCSQQKHLILPGGAGSPLEYSRIPIDTKTVPSLTYTFLNGCKYRIRHPTPIDANLSKSEAIAQLKGIAQLEHILATKYNTKWDFTALGLYSTISSEIRLARTRETINFGHHNFEWATKQVSEYGSAGIRLFDLYEQAAVFGYRDRIEGTAGIIQLGPMISSMITSQQVALGQLPAVKHYQNSNANYATQQHYGFDRASLYAGKRAVIYSTHDSILQLLLHRLEIISADEASYEARFVDWHKADDVDQLLAGLRMSKFGMSLVFELHEMSAHSKNVNDDSSGSTSLAFVEASLYNQEDGKYSSIKYRKLKLGKICRNLFRKQNPTPIYDNDLDELFYDDQDEFPIDREMSCPFELFKNVTSNYRISSNHLLQLCGA